MITNKTNLLLLGLLCLALLPACAPENAGRGDVPGAIQGQSPETELVDAVDRVLRLYAQSRYQEAAPFAEKALKLSEQQYGPDHPKTAALLHLLAVLHNTHGRYAEAEPLFKRALAIKEKVLGPEHPDVAESLNSLARVYVTQGRFSEAEPLIKRALAIREKALGPKHPDVAESLNTLALFHVAQGRYAEAEPLYQRALVIREKALRPENPHLAESLNNLGLIYQNQRRYAEAEPLFKRALALREKKALGGAHGPTGEEVERAAQSDVATSLENYASLLRQTGRGAEAALMEARAYVWYSLAAQLYPPGRLRDDANSKRDAVFAALTATQRKLAEREAAFRLGWAYHSGQGTEADADESLKFYCRSAELGLEAAGLMLYLTETDPKIGAKLMALAVTSGDPLDPFELITAATASINREWPTGEIPLASASAEWCRTLPQSLVSGNEPAVRKAPDVVALGLLQHLLKVIEKQLRLQPVAFAEKAKRENALRGWMEVHSRVAIQNHLKQ